MKNAGGRGFIDEREVDRFRRKIGSTTTLVVYVGLPFYVMARNETVWNNKPWQLANVMHEVYRSLEAWQSLTSGTPVIPAVKHALHAGVTGHDADDVKGLLLRRESQAAAIVSRTATTASAYYGHRTATTSSDEVTC
nr:hypothetical protein Iba_chr01cCG1080 [Ipomoea batatas]